MHVAVEYSFRFHYQDTFHEVVVPAEQLLGVPLDIDVVRQTVENDKSLLADLFGELLPQYLLMAKDPVYWSQDLQRENQTIKLVEA
ncbi:hypothetical protein [Paenarthrobacter histidinolovorans]|uniref:Uncharacterized protein n=1 Tax=Paenarthrobacter histidinolovorans TaxID=43664 RepID=A0ABW8N6Y1_9MICC|nr:hypothetical protein [Paenarthrobacter histidinolovorans]GGJ23421.1 hypothetical protein GCM10010052_20610 [Paenarthrobacter histidinolovorans]